METNICIGNLIRSDKGLTLETSALESLLRRPKSNICFLSSLAAVKSRILFCDC